MVVIKKERKDNSSCWCCWCCCKGCRIKGWNPGHCNKFDVEILVGPNSVTIKPVGNSEIKLSTADKVDLNENKLVCGSYLKSTVAYKFNYSKLIKNAKVTVDEATSKKPYLIAIVSLKNDESSKYIVIVHKEDGNMTALFCKISLTGVSLLSSNGITDMEDMFNGGKNLTVCNVNIDTSNVTNMSVIFYECSALTSLPDIGKWNTRNVISMNFMFYECKSLLSLPDISKWDTSGVTNMSSMFNGCNSLDKKKIPDKFK